MHGCRATFAFHAGHRMTSPFTSTPLLCGALRQPRQMLADQKYDGHKSIHDDAMAEGLGLRAGPIEGPTHFSQFDPLLFQLFGNAWFETGCISAHYQTMVVEGESVRAFVEMRRLLVAQEELSRRLGGIEQRLDAHDQQLDAVFDTIWTTRPTPASRWASGSRRASAAAAPRGGWRRRACRACRRGRR